MQKKLNEDFIDRYCEKFASEVSSSFFVDGKETITGKEILSITPSKQVNYFVVKLLFRYWQAETKKLESPFFNYKHPEVKQALIEFMNVLSQHIEVHKSKFELLLNHAVKDTLYLAAAPEAYIEIDLESRGVDKINEKAIAGTLKYLRLYKKEIHDFLSDMRGLTIDDIIDEVGPEFEDFDSSKGLANEVASLNEILPITTDQVLIDINELADDLDEFDDDDLFERGEEDLIETPKPTTSQETKEVKVDEPEEQEPNIPSVQIDEIEDKIDKTESSEKTEEMEEEIGEDDTPELEISTEETTKTINDQFEKATETVAEHHEKVQENSLMKAISVNHQFMFQKELFKDDPVAFQNALYELEEYNSFDDAVEFLVQGYAKEFNWDMQSTEVKELLKVLFRKFRE